ncbi:MAG TPA: ParB/RepB/Spo0J family partition protein [Candidatus Competibacteraceae bacterium]|nr:ParB/RepB/Spo0J family partition protein [Candidatus Competibacteraceae bacterium]
MLPTLELHYLQISALRPRLPLPWPTALELELVRQLGFVQPLIVRPLPATEPPQYEILSGLKQWLLAQQAQIPTAPVQIMTDLTEDEARRLVIQDTSLPGSDPISEARALQRRVEQGETVTSAGQSTGRTRTATAPLLRLLRLAPAVLAQVARGELPPGKARPLVGLSERQQLELAERIQREQLNTRQVETLAKAYKSQGRNDTLAQTSLMEGSAKDPNVVRLENELADLIGTPVTLSYDTNGRGQLSIAFDNLEILEGILERLGYTP